MVTTPSLKEVWWSGVRLFSFEARLPTPSPQAAGKLHLFFNKARITVFAFVRHKPATNAKVEDKLAQLGHRVGRFGQRVEVLEQLGAVHASVQLPV